MNGPCGSAVKYLVFFMNLVVFVMSGILVGYGIYCLGKYGEATGAAYSVTGNNALAESLLSTREKFLVIIGASGLALLASFLGCFGALKESRLVIWIYFVVMLLVSYLTISWGSVLVTPSGVERVRGAMFLSMRNYDPGSAADVTTTRVTDAWDSLQTQFHCCGVDGPSDWYNQTAVTTIFTNSYPEYPLANSTSGEYVVPDSCCKHLSNNLDDDDDYENCRTQTADGSGDLVGCYDAAVVEVVDQWLFVSIIVGIVAGVMFLNILVVFTFGLMIGPKGAYEPV